MSFFIELAKNNKFLPATNHLLKPRFYDSDELFNENLKTQPANWYYKKANVNYTLNHNGYRAVDFDTVDWENSIAMFGCSQLFGVGLDDTDTLPSQLSFLIKRPVINLGVIGSSMMFSFHNSLILKNICAKPLAVINMWTNHNRGVFYSEPLQHCGAWNYYTSPYAREWMSDSNNTATHAYFISTASKHLWSNTSYYEFSLFKETVEAIGCDDLNIDGGDYARDLVHEGRNTFKSISVSIANKLF